jgi:hypothetical protein
MTRFVLVLVAVLFILLPCCADEKCTQQTIINAFWIPQDNNIEVTLTGTMDTKKEGDARWSLINETNQSLTKIPPESVSYTDQVATITVKDLVLLNDSYLIAVTGIKFVDCAKPQVKFSPVALQTKRTKIPMFGFSPSTNRDDSDFYFAPTIDGASGTQASYTADSKLQYRKALTSPSFGGTKSYTPAIFLMPGADVKISSNPKEDGNSVLFQVPLEIVSVLDPKTFPKVSPIIPSVISLPAFVTESDKKFHDINAIFSDREYIVLHTFGNRLQFSPEPMIGFETGSNLKAQAAGTYPAAILRALCGIHVGMNIFQAKKPKPLFSIETDYILRVLLNPEPTYTTDSKGNYVLISTGTQPRYDINVKLNYNLMNYVALSVGYEYGRLPPVYTLVDNKYTFGITFKGQMQYKPKAAK